MDTGHYNCRDYYISPHFSATTITNERPKSIERHESFDELEERYRSMALQRPKFPLMRLPIELRQQILSYWLPHTQEFQESGLLGNHVRNFSAVQKRGARGMAIPNKDESTAARMRIINVVWKRGKTVVMSLCKQLHQECAELLYGTNTFLVFITYNGIAFRFRWLLPSGLAPSRNYQLLDLMPKQYLRMIRKMVVHVDHVDSYTGMIKFNVNGRVLTLGLRRQVQQLVNAIQPSSGKEESGLAKINIRVSNGNSALDAIKLDIVRQQQGTVTVSEDLEEMLEPFSDLHDVRQVSISGAVTDEYAKKLTDSMGSSKTAKGDERSRVIPFNVDGVSHGSNRRTNGQTCQLCVYGNDID